MTKALIIGGGIGGPVAAMALQRAGIDSVVYEARDQPEDYTGFFLNTASNGLAALRTIGVDVAGKADGFPIPNMVMWSGSGRRLGEVANGLELADGTVSLCVTRGLLQRLLREEALSRGSKMEFGKRMVSYDVTADGMVADFADGSSATGDPADRLGRDPLAHPADPQPGRAQAALHRPDRGRRLQPRHDHPADDQHPAFRVREEGVAPSSRLATS